MRSATRSIPRFRVGDWVRFLFGLRRVIVQIIEDRGLVGYPGRRLYGARLNRSPIHPRTTEVPEEDLEPAQEEILTPTPARERGITTGYWPRVEFDFRYLRNGKTHTWMAMPEFCRVVDSEEGSEATGPATDRWRRGAAGEEKVASVTIDQEFDPRLRDPRDRPELWWAMREEARKFADKLFKDKHPKAVIDRDHIDDEGRH